MDACQWRTLTGNWERRLLTYWMKNGSALVAWFSRALLQDKDIFGLG